jgi:hypothetical protein
MDSGSNTWFHDDIGRWVACGSALALSALGGCSGALQQPEAAAYGGPALASIDPLPPSPPEPPPPPAIGNPDDDSSAAGLLERGLVYLRSDRPALGAEAFRAALETGNLNNAGRSLAYWHIYLCEWVQAHRDPAADALESFLAASQDVLDTRSDRPEVLNNAAEFIERFDLDHRMSRARATLSALWADKIPSFGRSLQKPVPIQSDSEVRYFLELAPPCADAPDRQLARRPDVKPDVKGDVVTVQRVTLLCHGRKDGAEYYFEKTGTADAE